MRSYTRLAFAACLILTLNISAKTVIASDESLQSLTSTFPVLEAPIEPNNTPENDPDLKTYILNPIDTSTTTINNIGDGIGGMNSSPEEAWLAFDLSVIPKDAQVLSAALSVYILDSDGIPTQRTLWYYSNDRWIDINQPELSDPGDYVTPSQYVGAIEHDEQNYTWKTIPITYDFWENDINDGYISLMLTGPLTGFQGGCVALNVDEFQGVPKAPELTLTVLEKSKIYTNIFDLGPEEIVNVNGFNIDVGTYSVPSLADWNNDGLLDLIVGTGYGYIRIYLNSGTYLEPQFSFNAAQSFYARSGTENLRCTPSGCMGCFPRVVYWNDDDKKDLLVGQSDGTIKIFININTDEDPIFDYGTNLKVGPDGYDEIDVGKRATPSLVDWNNDGLKDLVCGAIEGKINIFLNEGTDTEPAFHTCSFAVDPNQKTIYVPGGRSSPEVFDLNFDGKKDILTGNTDGQLLLYLNVGTDKDPVFAEYKPVDANGIVIDLEDNPRSRPSICYWDSDGYPDVLIGAYDGNIHLYRCKRVPADLDFDGDIDFTDFALFAQLWHKTESEECDTSGADLNNDGKVDIEDATWITANWLMNIK